MKRKRTNQDDGNDQKRRKEDYAHWAKYLDSIFEKDIYRKIRWDAEKSLSYVTPYKQSKKMLKWFSTMDDFLFCRNKHDKIVFVETCGGLGGDSIQLLNWPYVECVISCEIDKKRYDCLVHNTNLVSGRHMYPRNQNFIEWWKKDRKFKRDDNVVVYVDPPWGGSGYQDSESIQDLFLEYEGKNYGCMDLVNLVKLDKNVDSVLFKLPFNFDTKTFNLEEFYVYKYKKTIYVLVKLS